MKPLSAITGGKSSCKLKWTSDMEEAFVKLKEAMAKDTQLVFPDYSEEADPLRLYVDASGVGAGAMLSQVQDGELRVIAFNSMTFSETQRRYSTIERELTAIRWGIKSFRAFLSGTWFVLHTDHQPLVYLHNMKLVDSRLARTLEDLSDFDFVIEYTPGKDNLAADALSRAPSSFLPEQVAMDCVDHLPTGLHVLEKVNGGGDSMLESLVLSLAHVAEHHELLVQNELSLLDLRDLLVSALLQNLDRYGLKGSQFPIKHLRLMKHPGQVMISEMFLVFADYFRVTVCVHYGGDKPIVFRTSLSTDIRVHVQCLAGIHFNPVKETRLYVHFVPPVYDMPVNLPTDCYEEDDTCVTEDEEPIAMACETVVTPRFTCQHPQCNFSMLPVYLGEQVFCALLDTGSQVSLMTRTMATICNVTTDRPNIDYLQGLGAVPRSVVDAGYITLCLHTVQTTINVVNFPFVIAEDTILPYCMVFGANLMIKLHVEMDFKSSCPLFQGQLLKETRILNVSETPAVPYVESALPLTESPGDSPILVNLVTEEPEAFVLSHELLLQDQLDNGRIRCLRRKLSEGSDGKDLPAMLESFRRVWRYLSLRDNLVVKRFHDSYVTVVSFKFMVAFVLNTHVDMAHIGTFKLMKLTGAHIWHPSLVRIVKDACRSCSVCQMGKAASNLILPPTIKVRSAFPFDLMAADLLSLPNTCQGYIGCLVVVDHYSKWLSVVPIKNKQCNTVITALRDRVFPGLLRLPCRLLTDNGPEFTGLVMEEFLDDLNIYHVKTTPYMPSSNGAVERVNRTVIGVLNKLGTAHDWATQLPRAVLIYNNTVHRELKMSPSQFLLEKCHESTDQPLISPLTREYWKEGHHRFTSFKVNDVVLRKVNRDGNRTVHKFEPRYSGPYRIMKVHENQVSYELCDLSDPDQVIRAHHVQLKPWNEPPNYILGYMARSPIVTSDTFEPPYRPSCLIGAVSDTEKVVFRESSKSSYVVDSSSVSSASSGFNSDDSNQGKSRVRFQLDSSESKDSYSFSGFNGFSPKSILKSPWTQGTETEPKDSLEEMSTSPVAGNGLIASSFLDSIAPVVLPTYMDSWELSPVHESPAELPTEITESSPAALVEERSYGYHPLDMSLIEDIRILFNQSASELDAVFNSLTTTVTGIQQTLGEGSEVDFLGFTPTPSSTVSSRLAALRGEVEEMRVRFAQGRKRHRDRCLALRCRISLGCSDVSSPLYGQDYPHTRSRGPVVALPHVLPHPLEWQGAVANDTGVDKN